MPRRPASITDDSNRERLVRVAAEVFRRRGVASTSMDDLVRESGVAKSNIYYHFKSKDEVILAVLEHEIAAFEARGAALLASLEGAEAPVVLVAYAQAFVDDLAGRGCVGGCPFAALAAQLAESHPPVRARLAAFFEAQTRLLTALVGEGQRRGSVRVEVPAASLAALLLAAMEGAMIVAQTRREVGSIEELVRVLPILLAPAR